MCVAAIAQIEFPRGRWLDVIDKLAANVNNEDKCFRLASIECLGFICEEVSLEEVKRDSKDLIFSAIVNTIEQNIGDPTVVEIGIKALYQSMQYTRVYFQDGNGHIILDAIKKAYEC